MYNFNLIFNLILDFVSQELTADVIIEYNLEFICLILNIYVQSCTDSLLFTPYGQFITDVNSNNIFYFYISNFYYDFNLSFITFISGNASHSIHRCPWQIFSEQQN